MFRTFPSRKLIINLFASKLLHFHKFYSTTHFSNSVRNETLYNGQSFDSFSLFILRHDDLVDTLPFLEPWE